MCNWPASRQSTTVQESVEPKEDELNNGGEARAEDGVEMKVAVVVVVIQSSDGVSHQHTSSSGHRQVRSFSVDTYLLKR